MGQKFKKNKPSRNKYRRSKVYPIFRYEKKKRINKRKRIYYKRKK